MNLLSASYLLFIIIATAVQNVTKKAFNKSLKGIGAFTFSAISVFTACIFFLILSGFNLPMSIKIVPYALGFSVSYFCATLFTFLSIQVGSLSLTSLVISYSLILPALYGIIFDGEKTNIWIYLGLALLVVSIVLLNAKKGDTKITLKWSVFAVISLIGNGSCAIIQTSQTKRFQGDYDNTFMFLALGISFIALMLFALFSEKKEISHSLKKGSYLMVLCGFANGLANLFVMLGSTVINKSIMFPIVSAGGIVVTWIISMFIYKEKLTKSQNLAMILGIMSIIFLNI